jgi:hypothetical protein
MNIYVPGVFADDETVKRISCRKFGGPKSWGGGANTHQNFNTRVLCAAQVSVTERWRKGRGLRDCSYPVDFRRHSPGSWMTSGMWSNLQQSLDVRDFDVSWWVPTNRYDSTWLASRYAWLSCFCAAPCQLSQGQSLNKCPWLHFVICSWSLLRWRYIIYSFKKCLCLIKNNLHSLMLIEFAVKLLAFREFLEQIDILYWKGIAMTVQVLSLATGHQHRGSTVPRQKPVTVLAVSKVVCLRPKLKHHVARRRSVSTHRQKSGRNSYRVGPIRSERWTLPDHTPFERRSSRCWGQKSRCRFQRSRVQNPETDSADWISRGSCSVRGRSWHRREVASFRFASSSLLVNLRTTWRCRELVWDAATAAKWQANKILNYRWRHETSFCECS